MRGRTDRIAVIHAIYGVAWAALAYATRSSIVTLAVLSAGTVIAILSFVHLRRTNPAVQADEATSKAIIRINAVTGIAIVATIVILHWVAAERYLVAAVLAVMGVHFLPLWKLLHRSSLAVMAMALASAAATSMSGTPSDIAMTIASLTFLVNSGRLLLQA